MPKIKEFNSNGDVVYTAGFGPLQGTVSFRAFRLDDWHAVPSYPPKVVARRSTNGTTVYMSWNGATDIDTWIVTAGQTNETLRKVQAVRKDGFETSVLLRAGKTRLSFVQVDAQSEGKLIGRSAVVPVA